MTEKQWKKQERRHTVIGISSLMISLILGIGCLSMNKLVFIGWIISCCISLIIACQEGEECQASIIRKN